MRVNTSADYIAGFVYTPASVYTWCMRVNTRDNYIVGAYYTVVHVREHEC